MRTQAHDRPKPKRGRPRLSPRAPANANRLREAIDMLGGPSACARLLGINNRAVRKWYDAGLMPRSEWTGETTYALRMSAALNDAIPPIAIRGLLYPRAVVQWVRQRPKLIKAA